MNLKKRQSAKGLEFQPLRELLVTSKMHTQITNTGGSEFQERQQENQLNELHLTSLNSKNQQQPSQLKQRNSRSRNSNEMIKLQDMLRLDIHQNEEQDNVNCRTNRSYQSNSILSKLPFLANPLGGSPNSNNYSNKIKLINDLQLKISMLQQNPDLCEGQMEDIEKDINQNFKDYYQQVIKTERDIEPISISSEGKQQEQNFDNFSNSDGMKFDNLMFQQVRLRHRPQTERQAPKNIYQRSERTKIKQFVVYKYVPKIVQVQVPYQILKPQDKSSDSSIQKIINKFSHNDDVYSGKKKIYNFSAKSESEKNENNLGIDSVSKNSQQSQVQGQIERIRQQYWQKQINLNCQFQHLNEISSVEKEIVYIEKQIRTEDQEVTLELKKLQSNLQDKQKQKKELKGKYEFVKQQFQKIKIKNKLQQEEIQKLERNNEKLTKSQKQLKQQRDKIRQNLSQKEVIGIEEEQNSQTLSYQIEKYQQFIEEKDNEIEDARKLADHRQIQVQELQKVNQDLKSLINVKQEKIEKEHNDHESQVGKLKEQIQFYSNHIESQGLKLNNEDFSHLKKLFEERQQQYQQKLKKLEHQLKTQSQQYEKSKIIIEQVKKTQDNIHSNKTQKNNKQGFEKVKEIFIDYDQLEKSQDLSEIKDQVEQFNECFRKGQFESFFNEQQKLKVLFTFRRLTANIKYLQLKLQSEQKEKNSLSKTIKSIEISINKQIKGYENSLVKSEQQNDKLIKIIEKLKQALQKQNQKKLVYKKKLHYLIKNEYGLKYIDINAYIVNIENELLSKENEVINNKYKKIKNYKKMLERQMIELSVKTSIHPCKHHEKLLKYLDRMQKQNEKIDLQNQTFSRLVNNIKRVYEEQMQNSEEQFVGKKQKKLKKIDLLKAKINQIKLNQSKIVSQEINNEEKLSELNKKKSFQKSQKLKLELSIKIAELGAQIVESNKKLHCLLPCQIFVKNMNSNGDIELENKRLFNKQIEEQQSNLVYRAPQVLLGFKMTQFSYVWTIAIIIDEILNGRLYYRKFDQIISRKQNYQFPDENSDFGVLLKQCLRKNQKQRISLLEFLEKLRKIKY